MIAKLYGFILNRATIKRISFLSFYLPISSILLSSFALADDLVLVTDKNNSTLQVGQFTKIEITHNPYSLKVIQNEKLKLASYRGKNGTPYQPLAFLANSKWQSINQVVELELDQKQRKLLLHCLSDSGVKVEVTLNFAKRASFADQDINKFSPKLIKDSLTENYFSIQTEFAENTSVELIADAFRVNKVERLFGGGQRFNSVNQRGELQPLWVSHPDGWRGYLVSAINNQTNEALAPFIISDRGYAVFFNTASPGEINFASTYKNAETLSYWLEASSHDHFIFLDNSPYDLVRSYVNKIGTPNLPAKWMFSVMNWDSMVRNQQQLLDMAAKFRQLNIPSSVLWLEKSWQGGESAQVVCPGSMEFSKERFPNPKGMIEKLSELEFRLMLWISPSQSACSARYQEAVEKNYLVQNSQSTKAPTIDVTNPAALKWWKQGIKSLASTGISGFKFDRGEENLGDKAIFASGIGNREIHNEYAAIVAQALSEAMAEVRGDDYLVIPRAMYAGSQHRASAMWAADQAAFTFDPMGMRSAIRAGQTAALSGYALWGSDGGGFSGFKTKFGLHAPTKVTFIRWSQFSALSPIMEVGGMGPHQPWLFDEDTVEIYRKYATLHLELFPYLYSYATRAHKDGEVIIKSLAALYPNDPKTSDREMEYFLGDQLLVRPIPQITSGQASTTIYFPEGQWLDYWTNEIVTGPVQLGRQYKLEDMPLFIKLGSLIPINFRNPGLFYETNQQWGLNQLEKPERISVRWSPLGDTAFENYDGAMLRGIDRRKESGLLEFSYTGQATELAMIVDTPAAKQIFANEIALPQLSAKAFQKSPTGWTLSGNKKQIFVKHRAERLGKLSLCFNSKCQSNTP